MSDGPIRVLIVDDEESLRGPLAHWLAAEHDYHVETAASGLEALDMLAADGCFDVVLLDYLLPAPYNGITLMEEIKCRCREASMDFIIFTGWGLDPQVGVEALKAGAYRYLSKPFDREELAILIQSIVEIRRTRERLEATSREKAWLESLLQVSQSVNSTLELDNVLDLILDEMKRVVVYDSASIQHITGAGLQVVACRGFSDPDKLIGNVFPPSDEFPNYRVWQSRQPRIEYDLQAAYHARHVRGWLGVPLIYRDEAIGVITLDSQTPGFYDEDDARVAMIFANQAAIAIENARLFSETQGQLDDLDKIHHASQVVASSLDLRQVLNEVVALAAEVAASDNVSVGLVDESGRLSESVEKVTDVFRDIPPLHERARADGITHRVLISGEPFIAHQVEPEGDHNSYLIQAGVASYVGLPLKTKRKVVGVLFVHSLMPRAFPEDRVALLMTFANQAAVAIENARLYDREFQQAKTLKALLEVEQEVTRNITTQSKILLDKIAHKACQMTGADCAVIYPYLAESRRYDMANVGVFGLRHELKYREKLRPAEGPGVSSRVLREGRMIIYDAAQDDPNLLQHNFVKREHTRAFVGIRLDATEPVGILFVNFRQSHLWSDDELDLIDVFANQAAIAIWNARLYGRTSEKLEQKVAELQTVSEINQLITSTLDLDEVLPLILDKAMELVNVQNGLLQLLEEETGELVIQSRTSGTLVPLEHPRLKLGKGVTGKAAQEKRSIIVHDVTQPPWRDIYVEFWPGTHSELAVPLLIGEQCIGVLNLEHPEPGYFSEDEREIIEGMAAQAAIAIHNAGLYDAIKRRSQHLLALHEASKAIAAGFAAKRKQVLDRIAEQAVERITGIKGPKAIRGAIMLYDEVANELQLESVYPPEALPEFQSRVGKRRPVDKDKAPNGRVGITGRTVLEGKPQRVKDVGIDSDYIEINATTRSELDVPLLDGSKIIGVLSVESDHAGAFDEDDEQALQALADLAVIAIKNSGRAEQLSRTNAVALMGVWGADVVHDVNREVSAIRRAIFGLQQRADLVQEVKGRLQDIDCYAGRLALPELPEQAPESGRVLEFRNAPLLDGVIRAEGQDLQAVYSSVSFRFEQNCRDIRVAIHEQWLRRLLRHLIRNAVKSFSPGQETRLVTIRTAVQGSMAEVQVEDTGEGVQPEIVPILFRQPIPHEDGRLGRGLLLVHFLAEQHGGYAKLVGTQLGEGACFAFGIPLAQPVANPV